MMIRPDLVITWHESCDYPIHRKLIKKYRDYFGKIIIYFSKHFRDPVYRDFLKEVLSPLGNIVLLDPIEYRYGLDDWRNISTNYMLKHSDGEWVCSWEGDFLAKDWDKLFNAVTEASKTYDILGYKGYQGQASHQDRYLTGSYVHPSFWFIKRELLEKTSKDFSADPKRGADHFGFITQDIERMKIPIWYTQDNGFPESDVLHQGGINQNYLEGLKDGFQFHRPELFYIYNWWSMRVDVPQSPEFMELCKKIDGKLKLQLPDVNPETDSRVIFFI